METLLPGLFHAPNIHPIFVHFPIVLWAVAALFLVIGTVRRRDNVSACGCWLLYMGMVALPPSTPRTLRIVLPSSPAMVWKRI